GRENPQGVHMIGSLLILAFVGTLEGGADGQPSSESAQPYHLRIVLQMTENRAFTPLFKDRVKRGLEDGLQAALGRIGQVEVVTRTTLQTDLNAPHLDSDRRRSLEQTLSLLDAVDQKGLRALDDFKQIEPFKTHFVLLDYSDGFYEIQTR